nr:LRRN4 C-terminal-like protein [Dromaius novaehollandiae]
MPSLPLGPAPAPAAAGQHRSAASAHPPTLGLGSCSGKPLCGALGSGAPREAEPAPVVILAAGLLSLPLKGAGSGGMDGAETGGSRPAPAAQGQPRQMCQPLGRQGLGRDASRRDGNCPYKEDGLLQPPVAGPAAAPRSSLLGMRSAQPGIKCAAAAVGAGVAPGGSREPGAVPAARLTTGHRRSSRAPTDSDPAMPSLPLSSIGLLLLLVPGGTPASRGGSPPLSPPAAEGSAAGPLLCDYQRCRHLQPPCAELRSSDGSCLCPGLSGPGVPPEPPELAAVVLTAAGASLRWCAPASVVLEYRVLVGAPGQPPAPGPALPPSFRAAALGGLRPDTPYVLCVVAHNGAGASPTPPPGVPGGYTPFT